MASKRATGMVRVVFPEPEETEDGTTLTMPGVLEEHVFVWEFWRTRDTTPLALALLTKFDPAALSAELTPLEAEKLEQGMGLAGKACSRSLNRFYLKCLLAVQRAEPAKS
jgi:hypothetical protein